jgi:serine phosphatase RsbU (regulator of sigma subunit)
MLAAGQLGGTIMVSREDELGELAAEFNGMSERLAESQRAIELRNARLSEGLNLARIIQQDLLPHGPPPSPSISANAACEPATEIGGDFYTYVPLPDGRVRLIIGDASGKGVAAALVMALTSSLVEVHARQATGPSDLMKRLNDELYPRFSTSHMCVALLVAEFDPRALQICVANAGMIAPLVVDPDGCTYVASYGPPLGVVADLAYDETTIGLQPEQAVVFISDGIVEARNPDNDMWGFANLESTVCESALQGTEGIVASVVAATKRHMQDTLPTDDMTIIAATLTPRLEEDNAYLMEPFATQLRSSL